MDDDNILIVDDEPGVRSALQRAFLDEPYTLLTAENAEKGLEVLRNNQIKVVISDEMMPGMHGAEFLSIVKSEFPYVIRIMLTGHASIEAAMKAINEGGIYRFFTKPWEDIELKMSIKIAIDTYNLEEENRILLEIIKRQAFDMKILEKQFPGISRLDRDDRGRIKLPDITEDEMEALADQFNETFDLDEFE